MRITALIPLVGIATSSCLLDWDTVDPRAVAGGGGSTMSTATATSISSTSASSTSASAGGGDVGGSAPWFDPSWPRRRPVEVGTVTGGPHTGFVVRVRLDDSRIDMAATNAGQDLRFVAADHATVLEHEVENWGTEGEVWVRLPSLDTGERFFMYYGNPSAPPVSSTPFDGYAAVWHLGSESDASGSGANATPAPAVSYVPGRIGLASAHTVNSPTQLDVPSQAAIEGLFTNGGTISVWIRATTTGGNGYGRIVDKATNLAGANGWTLHIQSTGPGATAYGVSFERGFSVSSGAYLTSASMGLDTWHHVALVHDDGAPTTTSVYIDGKAVAMNNTLPAGAPQPDNATTLRIGNESMSNSRSFDGLIDEVRLERVARSAGWIEADHLSGADQLLGFGPEELCPASVCP